MLWVARRRLFSLVMVVVVLMILQREELTLLLLLSVDVAETATRDQPMAHCAKIDIVSV